MYINHWLFCTAIAIRRVSFPARSYSSKHASVRRRIKTCTKASLSCAAATIDNHVTAPVLQRRQRWTVADARDRYVLWRNVAKYNICIEVHRRQMTAPARRRQQQRTYENMVHAWMWHNRGRYLLWMHDITHAANICKSYTMSHWMYKSTYFSFCINILCCMHGILHSPFKQKYINYILLSSWSM